MGAGAIGCTIGGRLAEGGIDVLLVARGEHARALQQHGLTLVMPERELHIDVPTVTTDDLELRPDDVILLAVKSQDTQPVLMDLAARPVADGTAGEVVPVFCVQNGTSNEDTASRFFLAVHGVGVNIPATHLEPGVVVAEGAPFSGALQVGRYPWGLDADDSDLVAVLRANGFDAIASDDVMRWKRAKLLRNVGNVLEVVFAMHDQPPLTESEEAAVDAIATAATAEGRACFEAANLPVTPDDEYSSAISGKARPTPVAGRARQGGSTWQSVQRGLVSVETDFLNGEIVRLGLLHGVPTPVNAALQARMRDALRAGGHERLDPLTFRA